MDSMDAELVEVLKAPGDIAARLAYARVLDARHDPLGEFIRLDCQLADATARGEGENLLELWDRRMILVEEHEATWLGPLADLPNSGLFVRGLVEHVELDLETYLERGDEIFQRFPIRSLVVRKARGQIDRLLASPWIDRVENLELPGNRHYDDDAGLNDEDVAELSSTDRLRNLRGLSLKGGRKLSPRTVLGVTQLADSDLLAVYRRNARSPSLCSRRHAPTVQNLSTA